MRSELFYLTFVDNIVMKKQNKFKDNLRIMRKERGLGQVELSVAVGVSKGSISFWENGLREPGMSELIALADYFNCTLDELVGRTD